MSVKAKSLKNFYTQCKKFRLKLPYHYKEIVKNHINLPTSDWSRILWHQWSCLLQASRQFILYALS